MLVHDFQTETKIKKGDFSKTISIMDLTRYSISNQSSNLSFDKNFAIKPKMSALRNAARVNQNLIGIEALSPPESLKLSN